MKAYDLMKRGLGMHEGEISEVFTRWNKGVLDSFLIEITADILKYNDEDGSPLVTKIMDAAGQKVSPIRVHSHFFRVPENGLLSMLSILDNRSH
jgi:6-phosphogluconate dehydrogenase